MRLGNRPSARRRRIVLRLTIVAGIALSVLPVWAQEVGGAVPTATTVPEPTPIPASQIPDSVGRIGALLRSFEVDAGTPESVVQISERLADVDAQITRIADELQPVLSGDGPPQALKDPAADLVTIDRRLTAWLTELNDMTTDLDFKLTDLRRRKEVWERTRTEAAELELPAALVGQVVDTIAAISAAEEAIAGTRAELLTVQAEVVDQRSRLLVLNEALAREIAKRQEHLLRLDSPPLWKAFGQRSAASEFKGEVVAAMRRNIDVVIRFVSGNATALARDLLVWGGVLAVFIWLGRWASLWSRTDESLRTTAALLAHPVASSLLVTVVTLGALGHPNAPTPVRHLAGVILLLAILRLLPRLVRREMKPAIGMLVALIVIFLVVDLIPGAYFLDRIGELFLALSGCAACGWALYTERKVTAARRDVWNRGALWLTAAAIVLFAGAALANLVGAVAFASLLSVATLGSIYDAIMLWIFTLVVIGVVTIIMRTAVARRLQIVRRHSDRIRRVLFKAIKAVALLVWLRLVLGRFQLFDLVVGHIKDVFVAEVGFGAFSISVSDVAVFAVVLWLSIKLARFTSFVLEEDVLPRLDLPKGVPATISKSATYLLVTLGVVIAVSAAGIDLSRATIIVGALGVGIGFGLQNAVNNFVSGLILLLGRPINVGDKIQIADVSGVVKDIGIRATVVETWQGAEVVVPNATLISDNLINWTLSNEKRRMEIQVGVAYGSPPDRVIELLTEAARNHDEVLGDPEPVTLFQGFGTSSLDFELRAWTEGNFVQIASDLRVEIERTLASHGIEIPFPQQDLHLRSVDERAAAQLLGVPGGGSPAVDDAVTGAHCGGENGDAAAPRKE